MTYQLTSEEMDMVREIVRILSNAYDSGGTIRFEDEDKIIRLAIKLDPLIR